LSCGAISMVIMCSVGIGFCRVASLDAILGSGQQ
jgi:hypothetical protein